MSRKHDDEEHEKENSERWLLTYSDMITLLLVLFIMMYTISKVDTQKFNALAESLGIVMNPNGQVGSTSSGSSASADGILSDAGYAVSLPTQEPEASSAATPTAAVSFTDDELLNKIQSLITRRRFVRLCQRSYRRAGHCGQLGGGAAVFVRLGRYQR